MIHITKKRAVVQNKQPSLTKNKTKLTNLNFINNLFLTPHVYF